MEREVDRALRERHPVGIVIADLDHFKRFNDQYGHLCDDDIIREMTDRFRSVLREYDLVGRYGGEDFLLLFPGLDLVTAPDGLDDLRNAISSEPFIVAGTEIQVTCSFGVATFYPESDPQVVPELLHRADTALYVAKSSGRNSVGFESIWNLS
jgi:diguanylate cyclase (GGDEF)-like protein